MSPVGKPMTNSSITFGGRRFSFPASCAVRESGNKYGYFEYNVVDVTSENYMLRRPSTSIEKDEEEQMQNAMIGGDLLQLSSIILAGKM